MKPSRIQAVDHVNLEAPPDVAVEDVRWFYGELVGLEELPSARDDGRLICFKSEHIELRVSFVETPAIEAVACRVVIAVGSLDEAAALLEDRKITYTRLSGFMFTDRRIEVHDPAGNRIALKQAWPDLVF